MADVLRNGLFGIEVRSDSDGTTRAINPATGLEATPNIVRDFAPPTIIADTNGTVRNLTPSTTGTIKLTTPIEPAPSSPNVPIRTVESEVLPPCHNINDYGISMKDMSFVFKDEVIQYLSNPSIDKISTLDEYTKELLLASKIINSEDNTKIYRIQCTDYYVNNLNCFIEHVSYDRIPELNLFIAKYYFPLGIPSSVYGINTSNTEQILDRSLTRSEAIARGFVHPGIGSPNGITRSALRAGTGWSHDQNNLPPNMSLQDEELIAAGWAIYYWDRRRPAATEIIYGPKSPDGYFYITTAGRLCYLTDEPPTVVVDPPIVITLPPTPDVITPDTPLVGGGSTYAPISDQYSSIDFITKPLWPCEATILNDAHIDVDGAVPASVIDEESLCFGFDVYDKISTDVDRKKLFRISYGDFEGLGITSATDGKTLTKAVYSQYAQKLLSNPLGKFVINGVEQDSIYVIDIERSLYKNWVDAGNFELGLIQVADGILDYDDPYSTDSLTWDPTFNLSLVDTNVGQSNPNEFKDSYSIKEGTLEDGIIDDLIEYGILYPKHGILVLSPDLISTANADLEPIRLDKNCYNALRFFQSISTEVKRLSDPVTLTANCRFIARYIDVQYNQYIFARIKNGEFNFSNNPTYRTGDEGDIFESMSGNPKVYATSIGLYNDKKELIAVGKFFEPLVKSFQEEAVVTVKIGQ